MIQRKKRHVVTKPVRCPMPNQMKNRREELDVDEGVSAAFPLAAADRSRINGSTREEVETTKNSEIVLLMSDVLQNNLIILS